MLWVLIRLCPFTDKQCGVDEIRVTVLSNARSMDGAGDVKGRFLCTFVRKSSCVWLVASLCKVVVFIQVKEDVKRTEEFK